MEALISLLYQFCGFVFAVLGAFFSVFFSGIGSAKGCGLVGKSATGVITEEPEKFGGALILQLLPGTQGLYGFIIGALIILLKIPADVSQITLQQGLYLTVTGLLCGLVQYRSAIYQGEVAASGLQILVKNPLQTTKGIIFAAVVETYAILGFVSSILLLFVVQTG